MNKKLVIKVMVSFIALAFLSACAAPLHMTFNSPKGNDWIKNVDKKYGLTFTKPTLKGKDHTIIAFATSDPNPGNINTIKDLLQYAEQKYRGENRFKLLNLKTSTINLNGKDKVKLYFKVEDHGVPWAKPGTFYIIEGYDYFWIDQDNSEFISHSGYSQRFLPGDQPLEGIEEEVEPFLKSVVFVSAASGKETPLIKASKNGYLPAVEKMLLSKEADLNAKGLDADWGKTALMEASNRGYTEIVQALLSAGADVNATDFYGDTALMLATFQGHINIVRLLLGAGADVNIQNTAYGSTALMGAIGKCNRTIAQILLDAGADVHIRDNKGRTALTGTNTCPGKDIVELLTNAGAERPTH
jgi:hypothetical protein